jgi:hypothetical protein
MGNCPTTALHTASSSKQPQSSEQQPASSNQQPASSKQQQPAATSSNQQAVPKHTCIRKHIHALRYLGGWKSKHGW